jgi:hypothetical protein
MFSCFNKLILVILRYLKKIVLWYANINGIKNRAQFFSIPVQSYY